MYLNGLSTEPKVVRLEVISLRCNGNIRSAEVSEASLVSRTKEDVAQPPDKETVVNVKRTRVTPCRLTRVTGVVRSAGLLTGKVGWNNQ